MSDERQPKHRATVVGVVLEARALAPPTSKGTRPSSATHPRTPVAEPVPVAPYRALALPPPRAAKMVQKGARQPHAKAASSADLIKDFESAVRKVVDTKRSEADKLQFSFAKKSDDVARAQMALLDLRRECAALGITESTLDDVARLQTIASYSRRPFYAKNSKIRHLEEKLALKTTEIYAVVRKILSYEHIKRRHEMEKTALITVQHQLTHDLCEKSHRIQELHRLEIVASEALNSAQSRLAELKATIAREVRLFETELSYRERWLREKAKFQAFYERQIDSIPDIVGGRRSSAIINCGVDKTMSKRWSLHMVVKALEVSRLEDKRCEEAFRRIGLHGDRVDPNEIVMMCKAHEQLRDELQERQATQTEHLASVKRRIDALRIELQGNRGRTTRRLIIEDDNDVLVALQKQERLLHKARDQYEFIQQIVNPVKAGIQQIVSQVTSETVNVESVKAIEIALERVEVELSRFLNDSSSASSKEGLTAEASSSSLKAATLASWTKPNEITSPHNVRVKPKEEWYFPQHSAEASPVVRRHHRGAATPHMLRDFEDSAGDNTTHDGVMDRDTVKQISTTLTTLSKKKREAAALDATR
ncbi:hypothetical protein SDRG_09894 [Saprolegnia diclina VS20]|uniref:Uncharacterized protein n=1 Tax=Saprolegnia diclina (strain VS20) TaxID=1156394 RepID=T0QCY8_SAPDV|nr:hypothetical protein SDRG_09894 [Saprolegnia diclina VS20]EQC32576.1 hypothetical protein SDRG_09894 [Saprolegnia diclina VS20]|eukprot:XP_008614077.1 hypothetical protein SDRG_09894 [Saprolegnia diclina VS20]